MRVITVTDPRTGESETIEHPDGFGAVVICDDGWYLDGIVKYATGTFVATVKRVPVAAGGTADSGQNPTYGWRTDERA